MESNMGVGPSDLCVTHKMQTSGPKTRKALSVLTDVVLWNGLSRPQAHLPWVCALDKAHSKPYRSTKLD